jgi:hypothetical protein
MGRRSFFFVGELLCELMHARLRSRALLPPLLEMGASAVTSSEESFLVQYVDGVSNLFRRSYPQLFSCLHYSIAGARVLRRRGVGAAVRIAPLCQTPSSQLNSKDANFFKAHAWIEVQSGFSLGAALDSQTCFVARASGSGT